MATATKHPPIQDTSNTSVRVEIFDQAYNLRGTNPEYILKLAEYVDGKMRAVADQTHTVDSSRLAVLAAGRDVEQPNRPVGAVGLLDARPQCLFQQRAPHADAAPADGVEIIPIDHAPDRREALGAVFVDVVQHRPGIEPVLPTDPDAATEPARPLHQPAHHLPHKLQVVLVRIQSPSHLKIPFPNIITHECQGAPLAKALHCQQGHGCTVVRTATADAQYSGPGLC